MADAMPNYQVEQLKLVAQIAGLKANIARQTLEIAEMEDRKARYIENIASTKESITEYEKQLKGLEQEHGKAEAPV
jgi:chromosome segregation ATPase